MGNALEANQDLERISAAIRSHPDVLEVRWQVSAELKDWAVCIDAARAMTEVAPERPFGWIHFSFALHELKRTQEAWDNLSAAVEKFPGEPTISYNLACYACQLGRRAEAEEWLQRAFQIGDTRRLKSMALKDPDLKPLWERIEGL